MYTFTRNQVIYAPIDLEALQRKDLSSIEQLDGPNGEKYSIIDSSTKLFRFKKAQFIYLNKYVQLEKISDIKDIIEKFVSGKNIELGPTEEFLHST